ncbi:MAG: ester cyclase [Gammaproteobacteria bacterium]|nr:ester cyclase [Gammaproteobacteria bacterium]
MSDFQANKELVMEYYCALDAATGDDIDAVIKAYTGAEYLWRGMHPFYEQHNAGDVANVFWKPFRQSFTSAQRRQDVFMSGGNSLDDGETEWVCSMGHMLGLFDEDWLGIPSSGKMAFLRYAEFHRIADGKIAETALFCDIISVMQQVGLNPLPLQTGAAFIAPGPRTHDGLMFDKQDPVETQKTLDLINQLINDLTTSYDLPQDKRLARSWHKDMIWYGPAGIGATFTRERYVKQHQGPFRTHLQNLVFNGHVSFLTEGCYGGFFGWANLSMTTKGNFMGLPASDRPTEMRVVDIYRRDGEKLAENWVFIDILHFLSLQGLDVLDRMKTILRT